MQKKAVHNLCCFPTCNQFFCKQDCRSGWFKLKIKASLARHQKPRILEHKPLIYTSYHIQIDWSWNIFTLHNFCSLLIKQLIDLEKVRRQYSKSESIFSSREQIGAGSDCSEMPCVCAHTSDQPKLYRSAAQKACQLILPSKPSISKFRVDILITLWSCIKTANKLVFPNLHHKQKA